MYSYCWIRNTYYLLSTDEIPSEEEVAKRARLPYYQWVPMILLVQAMLFYLPYGIWVSLSSRSGVDVHSIVEAGQSFTVTDMTEIRDKTLMYMTLMMDRSVVNNSLSLSSLSLSLSVCYLYLFYLSLRFGGHFPGFTGYAGTRMPGFYLS